MKAFLSNLATLALLGLLLAAAPAPAAAQTAPPSPDATFTWTYSTIDPTVIQIVGMQKCRAGVCVSVDLTPLSISSRPGTGPLFAFYEVCEDAGTSLSTLCEVYHCSEDHSINFSSCSFQYRYVKDCLLETC